MAKVRQISIFKASYEAEEKQKEKLAIDLHDQILPLLVALQQKSEEHKQDLKTSDLRNETFDLDIQLIQQSIEGIRGIAFDLVPNVFIRFGLISALERTILELNSKLKAIRIDNNTDFKGEIPFSKPDQVQIFRICMELLNNIKKHANYDTLVVTIANTRNTLLISFTHDGQGVTNDEIEKLAQNSKGLGLNSLKSRSFLLKATINYTKALHTATVTLTVPFSE